MSAVVSGLVGAVAATALVAVAIRTQAPAKANAEGWKVLRPGWLLNGTIIGCAGLATLVGYVFLFVGSSRPDADTQMTYALLLAIAFGLGAAFTGWASYGRTIMWKDDELRIRSRLGRGAVHRLSDIASVTHSDARSEYRLAFRDGATLRLSTYLNGARELAAALGMAGEAD